MAGLRPLGTVMCIVAILAGSMLLGSAAHAEQGSSTARRPNDLTVHPFATFVIEASRRFRVPETLDTRRHARRKRWRTASSIEKGRHVTDADYARNMDRVTVSLTVLASTPTTPMTTSRLVQYTSVSSTIVTDARRGSSPPTMQDLDATNGHLATGRAPPHQTWRTSRRSPRSSRANRLTRRP